MFSSFILRNCVCLFYHSWVTKILFRFLLVFAVGLCNDLLILEMVASFQVYHFSPNYCIYYILRNSWSPCYTNCINVQDLVTFFSFKIYFFPSTNILLTTVKLEILVSQKEVVRSSTYRSSNAFQVFGVFLTIQVKLLIFCFLIVFLTSLTCTLFR